jgi:hypothetical protein
MGVASFALKAADGMTPADVAKQMLGKVDQAADDAMKLAGNHAKTLISSEGARHFIRARKTRKPVHLSAKLGPHSKKQAIVYGTPTGFWTIVDKGSKRHRIERKFKGSGKKRYAQLLRTPYGPRPYVLHPGHGPQGHPWDKAMVKVNAMPQSVFEPAIDKAFASIWD